jgi:hypothetical protein
MSNQNSSEPIRVFAASDLHLEFAHFEPNLGKQPDLVLLAGDIGRGSEGAGWSKYYFPDVPVVFILGNHESYRDQLDLTLADCREAARELEHLYFLENDSVTLTLRGRSVRILGTTLWTDFKLNGARRQDASMEIAQRSLSDYKLIEYRGAPLRPASRIASSKLWRNE